MENNTLDYYNNNSEQYFNNTLEVNLSHIYKIFLKDLHKDNTILDLGCGSGRDSLYFKQQGYQVTALDGSAQLAEKASKILGQEVLVMNFEQITLTEKFDGIWACASLLHVKKENILEVVNKLINNNLKQSGVFYMSFKYGDKEYTDSHGRYFNCYTEESFEKLIENVEGLHIEKIFKTEDIIPGRENLVWLNVVCKNKKQIFDNKQYFTKFYYGVVDITLK